MQRWMRLTCLSMLAAGCGHRQAYEINFNEDPSFQWDGKVRLVKFSQQRLGPLLSTEEDSRIESITLGSRDGREAMIDPTGYKKVPLALVGPQVLGPMRILGTEAIWRDDSVALVCTTNPATLTQPATSQPAKSFLDYVRQVPSDKRPYAKHVAELTLHDWWAIALQEGASVTVEFELPHEDVRIIAKGEERQYGPEVVEVRTKDGKLLKRYEQRSIEAKEVDLPRVEPQMVE